MESSSDGKIFEIGIGAGFCKETFALIIPDRRSFP
jgi:hypothetical protein